MRNDVLNLTNPMEESELEQILGGGDGVSGDFFQTDASDAGCLCAEIASQQFLADPYGLKNLCAPEREQSVVR